MNRYRQAALLLLLLILLASPVGIGGRSRLAAGALHRTSQIDIDPQLMAQIAGGEPATFLIRFRERPDLSAAHEMPWQERGHFVVAALQAAADGAQAGVRAYLKRQGVPHQSFWIDNLILVEGAPPEIVHGLLDFPTIAALDLPVKVQLMGPERRALASEETSGIEPNIEHVGAPDLWAQGITGAGIVVATIDSGAHYSHEALRARYRGMLEDGGYRHHYNWLDPYPSRSPMPVDPIGHGSHVMGTMLGSDGGANQVGVAPGARWIACRGCDSFECAQAKLLACAQWMLAPTRLDGSDPDPDRRPHVVNNSWGACIPPTLSSRYDPWFERAVESWLAAGIYPIFAAGNARNCGYPSPPGPRTVSSPALYGNVTAVGSTGRQDGAYADHSAWGPTDHADGVNPRGYPYLKPQVVAPGVAIRSSTSERDDSYELFDGTSMSAPHVAGVVALMWEAAPCLVGDYALTETFIEQTARPIPYRTGVGDEGPGNIPNHATGWGEVDAVAAVEVAREHCLEVTPAEQSVCVPASARYQIDVPASAGSEPLSFTVTGAPEGTRASFSKNPLTPPGRTVLTVSSTTTAQGGSYDLHIDAVSSTTRRQARVGLDLSRGAPGRILPISPADESRQQPLNPTLRWSAEQAGVYDLEVATDSTFTTLVYTATDIPTTTHTIALPLEVDTRYYWRVRGKNACGTSDPSPPASFTTLSATGLCTAGATAISLFHETFEGKAPGWMQGGENSTWALSGERVRSGAQAWHATAPASSSDQNLISPQVHLPLGVGPLTLEFWSYQDLEAKEGGGCFDGGILEIFTEGGTDWRQLPGRSLLALPYDGLIDTKQGNPLVAGGKGIEAWCGVRRGWTQSVVSLDEYEGQKVRFRFRLGTDGSTGTEGWYIDDVKVQVCQTTFRGFFPFLRR